MPNIKSAKKKVRQDVKREKQNSLYERAIRKLFSSKGRTGLKGETAKKAFSLIDKAAKKNVIHKNKAARLKARVSRLTKSK